MTVPVSTALAAAGAGTGLVDDSQALADAMAAVAAQGGGIIDLGPGTFLMTSPWLLIADNIQIRGAGQNATTIQYASGGCAIQNSDTTVLRRRFVISDLTIDNLHATDDSGGIRFENVYDASCDRVTFANIGAAGVGALFVGTGSTYFNTCNRCLFQMTVIGSTAARWLAGAATPNSNRIVNSYVTGNVAATGFDIQSGSAAELLSCEVNVGVGGTSLAIAAGSNYNQITAVHFDGSGPVTVAGNYSRFANCMFANSVTFTDTGVGTVRTSTVDGSAANWNLTGGGSVSLGQAPSIGLTQTTIKSTGLVVNDGTRDRVIAGQISSAPDYGLKVVSSDGTTVIIDGTSDMFKIAATGTLTKAFPAAGTSASAATTLTGLGTFTLPPAVLFMTGADNSSAATTRTNGSVQITVAATGAPFARVVAVINLNGSSQAVISLNADSSPNNPGTTAMTRYYVLTEAGI